MRDRLLNQRAANNTPQRVYYFTSHVPLPTADYLLSIKVSYRDHTDDDSASRTIVVVRRVFLLLDK